MVGGGGRRVVVASWVTEETAVVDWKTRGVVVWVTPEGSRLVVGWVGWDWQFDFSGHTQRWAKKNIKKRLKEYFFEAI